MTNQENAIPLAYEMALKCYESSRHSVDSIHNALNQLMRLSLLIIVLGPVTGHLGLSASSGIPDTTKMWASGFCWLACVLCIIGRYFIVSLKAPDPAKLQELMNVSPLEYKKAVIHQAAISFNANQKSILRKRICAIVATIILLLVGSYLMAYHLVV